ncbi:hypothetical protein [Desulfotomaculum copahuensis]|uniref:Uncharacterized protein n=1 Tax=Desulfotomaculum copahuensis TaxID=1838280 RepID=A0A1B7LFL5_9FIRM|nr:hypothetical protein [Desulfotomaculum copahuensis]OAT82951.1 hypothetical protein A6M21_08310 [Desulfotomaculum copahuensis]
MENQNTGSNSLYFLPLLLLATKPDVEYKLAHMSAVLKALQETAQVFRAGLQNFQAGTARPPK